MGFSTAQTDAVCLHCGANLSGKEAFAGYCLCCLFNSALGAGNAELSEPSGWFDHYEVETHPDGSFVELGRGAMGVTYKAVDTTLRFPVALKAIQLPASEQQVARERFLREARAAARLRHPHVASVLYFGVRDEGQCFYAMEFVDGETLAARVQRSGPLPAGEALEIISQVASALEASEKQGLVHRDLKPANLMLVKGSSLEVKVIDFGLAKALNDDAGERTLTHGAFVGTPAFASPEHFSGEAVDARSDFFSLGATLWFLLCGKAPFRGQNPAEIHARQLDGNLTVKDLTSARVPQPVIDLACSLLQTDPAKRPQSAEALRKAISQCQAALSERTTKRFLRPAVLVPCIVLLLAAAGVTFFVLHHGQSADIPERSLAVLPFENLGAGTDNTFFADGVQDDILTELAKVADLRVISRGSVQTYRDPVKRPAPSQIGEALGVHYLLSGTIRRDATRIRVNVQLIEAASGREKWAEHYDRELADLFAIQSQIAEQISRELKAELSAGEKALIEETPTRDLAAYELYLHAKELMANFDEATLGWESLYTAVRLLDEATTRDPSFALAWCLLAEAHDNLYWYNADHTDSRKGMAETALENARRLRPDLGEVHLAVAVHLKASRDYQAVRRELELARQTLPNSVELLTLLGDVDLHQGRWRDGLQHYEQASALDPKDVQLISYQLEIYQWHRRYNDARRLLDQAGKAGMKSVSIDYTKAVLLWQEKGDTSGLHSLLDEPAGPLRAIGRATLLKIQCALADRNFATTETILNADPKQEFEGGQRRFLCRDFVLGWIKYSSGDLAAAQKALVEARPLQQAYVEKWPDDPNPLMLLAVTDARLGHKEDAIREAREAVAMRPISQDAIDGPSLGQDLAEVYLLVGERELAIQQLEALEQTPRALTYGFLAKMPNWDALRNDARFQQLILRMKPIPIENVRQSGDN